MKSEYFLDNVEYTPALWHMKLLIFTTRTTTIMTTTTAKFDYNNLCVMLYWVM